MNIKNLVFAACVIFVANIAQAAPVVTFTTSGSSGAWTVNFSILNNLGASNIYWFGIDAPADAIIKDDMPTGWFDSFGTSMSDYGSSSTVVYNDVWLSVFDYEIAPGQTLDGFKAVYNTVAAPTNISWFAFASGGPYSGTDNFNINDLLSNTPDNSYPGFEGVATTIVTPVPEPQSYAMLLVGFGLLGFTMRRRRNTNA